MNWGKMKSGQAAIEMLVIMGVSIVILMAILTASQEKLSNTNNAVAQSQVSVSLKKLANAADFVYSQSVGAAKDVFITVPAQTKDIKVGPHYIEFLMSVGADGSDSSMIEITIAGLNGTIDPSQGIRRVKLTNFGEYVQIE